jgi:hypothetical protein
MKTLLRGLLVRVVAPALIVSALLGGIVLAQNTNGIRGQFSGTIRVAAPFRLDMNGHLNASGTNGADFAGTCTLGTSCVITFTQAYKNAPGCIATDNTAAAATKAVSTTSGVTFTGTGTDVLTYVCVALKD